VNKKSYARGITIPDCKLYYRVIAIKTDTKMSGTKDPDINPCKYTI
jgi:hypothetical protein